ncbi:MULTISPECIES: hypothetical protein [unclassified Saccharothrix]|uniref:hypothetical protein n=1 Tax=unclassified Saccharothrix TaxID=2593673 RepID=UPI00307F7084
MVDVVGSLTSSVAVLGLVLVLHEGPERGWTDPITLLGLLVGAGAARRPSDDGAS